MDFFLRNAILGVVCLAMTGYTAFVLRGPQGIPALLEKRQDVKRLQGEVEALQQDNRRKRERIEELKNSKEAIVPIIRDNTKMLKQGETAFIVQDSK